jgi:Amidohydrolase family
VDDPWETIFAPCLFGPERFGELYPTRTLIEAGVVLVWGSGSPVTGVSPLEGLETASTHRYPGGEDLEGREDHAWKAEEGVSPERAIVAYTSAGAYRLHDERSRGSLEAGKAADLTVLGRNLLDTPLRETHGVPVRRRSGDLRAQRSLIGEWSDHLAPACVPLGQKLVSSLVMPVVVRDHFAVTRSERPLQRIASVWHGVPERRAPSVNALGGYGASN